MPDKIGHYKIVSLLGRGGMGVVYKAHEESLNRFVAIKVLGEHLAEDPGFLSRFVREAQAAAGLSHPNIVQIYFIGEDNGQHYFVMEYVTGQSLQSLITERGKIDNPQAAQLILQAAHGLAAAHDKGIIHRDIKPANLILDTRGMVKIADFGIALPVEAQTRLTATGMLMGTPGYLSPEQCLGEHVDHRADIYALGVTYYELLTGRAPFRAESPLALLRQILQEQPPDVSTLNPEVDEDSKRILLKMIAKDRNERYQNCHQVVDDLEQYVAGRGVRSLTGGLTALLSAGAAASAAEAPTMRMADGPMPTAAPPTPPPATAPMGAAAVASAPTFSSAPTAASAPGAASTEVVAVRPQQPAVEAEVMPKAVRRSGAGAFVVIAIVVLLIGGAAAAAWVAYRMVASKGLFGAGAAKASVISSVPAGANQTGSDPASTGTAVSTELSVQSSNPANDTIAAVQVPPLTQSGNVLPPNGSPSGGAGPGGGAASAVPPVKTALQEPGRHVQSAPPPRQSEPARSQLTGVAYAVVGDPGINSAVENVLGSELSSAGLDANEAGSLPGLDGAIGEGVTPGSVLGRLRRAGVAVFVFAKVEPTGQRELHYLNRYDTAYSSRITLTAFDVESGRPIGARQSGTIEYTTLNADREAEKVVGRLARELAGHLPRR